MVSKGQNYELDNLLDNDVGFKKQKAHFIFVVRTQRREIYTQISEAVGMIN